MYAYTELGDYPMIVPDHKITSPEELFPGWMLLSHNKSVDLLPNSENIRHVVLLMKIYEPGGVPKRPIKENTCRWIWVKSAK